ncbi:hypothetical protein K469DRAFT_668914 [Zopfia rhizophila CBS 207.26]|uniref:C2H2-type domain-containing protein n=1 Tax=Zopfia rhizophila CBS 207.26 TaxID=1314779 RepID=A0A6A6DYB2_9PEZI|nr:hypothetical protein K469DRAFT_668914 [Zopfia rhizophila CBS 207.26]
MASLIWASAVYDFEMHALKCDTCPNELCNDGEEFAESIACHINDNRGSCKIEGDHDSVQIAFPIDETCYYEYVVVEIPKGYTKVYQLLEAMDGNTKICYNFSSGMTSAVPPERNSQAGPHKCERIHPRTGRPCNKVFGRVYDLTRHENTVHAKQVFRCEICGKTLARSDALTKHIRSTHIEKNE